jgi:hypothetical protein
MALNTSRSRHRGVVAARATTTALTLGGGLALGGNIAAAGPGDLTSRPDEPVAAGPGDLTSRSDEPVAVGLDPVTIRLLVAAATCTEIYPPGTDITACVANLY